MADAAAAVDTVVFVIPPDRGHLLYTFHVAAELHARGYAIEYWSPSSAASAVPVFAKFHSLSKPGDDTFERFTRTYCKAKCFGDTYEESEAHYEQEFPQYLAAEFEDPDRASAEMQGTQEALLRLKQRVLGDDVALCIFDASHIYSWIGQHCADLGVPTLGLYPTPLWLRLGKDASLSPPGNLTDEPEYLPVRKNVDAVPHRIVYPLLPDLLEGCTIPEGRRVTGPVLPSGDVPEEQCAAFTSSGLRAWCDDADTPIVYVSFGSMARSGPVQSVARRLVKAIAGGPWRVLIAAAPVLFEGSEPLPASVRVEEWVPQFAVLAHPRVKAFISHCGATSINEAVLHAVPIVSVPLFDDQRFNAPAAVACGAAVAELQKDHFTSEAAFAAVRQAVESEAAAANALAASQRLRSCNGLAALVEEAEALIAAAKIMD